MGYKEGEEGVQAIAIQMLCSVSLLVVLSSLHFIQCGFNFDCDVMVFTVPSHRSHCRGCDPFQATHWSVRAA